MQSPVEQILDKGYASYDKGNYEDALRHFESAKEIDPDNPEVYYLKGLTEFELGNTRNSIEDLEQAIQLDPNYVDAYQQMGYIYLVNQAGHKAIDAFDEAIARDSTLAESYINRGTAKCMIGDQEGALADWDKAKSLGVSYTEFMTCD